MRLHSKHQHPVMFRHNGIEIHNESDFSDHTTFSVQCVPHDVECMADSMADAQRAARDPASWCPECRDTAKRQRKAKGT